MISGTDRGVSVASGDWVYLRDTIRVNDALLAELQAEKPAPGTRVVLIAREIVHDAGFVFPLTGFPVLLVAETYRGNGGTVATTGPAGVNGKAGAAGGIGGSGPDNTNGRPGEPGGNGMPGGTATPITLFAATLTDLTLNARGGVGGNGGRGGTGKDGVKPPRGGDGRDPGSGGRGGNGGNAAVGGSGAQIRVESVTRSGVRADGSGGDPGIAGQGGSGGSGGGGWNGPGESGPDGVDGLPGQAAGPSVQPDQRDHTADAWWTAVRAELGDAYTQAWAEYRTLVGEFLFRTYAPALPQRAEARIAAGHEFGRALVLKPELARAAELSRHLAHNLTPIGVPYDLDLMPDFPAQEKFVDIYGPLVQASLIAARDLLLTAIGKADKIQLVATQVAHLDDLRPVLEVERNAAKTGLDHAKGRADVIDMQMREVNAQLDAVRAKMVSERLEFPPGNDLGPVIGAAIAIASLASAVYTGGLSLVALLAAGDMLAKNAAVLEGFDTNTGKYGDGSYLVNWFDWKGTIPKLRSDVKIDTGKLEKLGDQTTKFIHAAGTVADLLNAKVDGKLQNAEKDLLVRQMELLRERALQVLEVSQKQLTVVAAERKIAANANDIARLTHLEGDWEGDVAQLVDIARRLIDQNRHYMDLLIEYCFYAHRALDLWTLSNLTPTYTFDMGYLHPDDIENAYRPLPRGDDSRVQGLLRQYQTSWQRLPQLADLRRLHDRYPVDQDLHYFDLNTPELLDALRTKGTATFTLPLDAFPNRFAMKVAYVHVGLLGARAETPRMTVVIEHGGLSTNRAEDGTTVDAQAGPLSSTVQATFDKHDPGTPSVRQAYWGRSPAATWRITIEKSAAEQAKLDLGGLNDVFLTLWYWHRGATPSGPPAARMALTADFDGDGRRDEVIWDPADGSWRVTPASGGGTRTVILGGVGDLPVPADYDGDGRDELAVFRPATGKVFARALAGGPPAAYHWASADRVLTADERRGAERLVGALEVRARELYGAVRPAESVEPQSAVCTLLRRLATLDAGYRPRIGEALVTLTTILTGADRWDEAVATGEEAVALYRTLAAEHPGNDEFVYRISWASIDVATHLWAKAELRPTATDLAVRAIDNMRTLAGRSPGYRLQFAKWAALTTTPLLAAAGRWDEAVALGDEAIALYRKLAGENAVDDELAYGVSAACLDVATHLSANPELRAKAADLAVQGTDNMRTLAGRSPGYRLQFAKWAALTTTPLLAAAGRWDEAVALGDEAIALYRKLAGENAVDDELAYGVSAACLDVATHLWANPGLHTKSADLAVQAVDNLRALARRSPGYRPQLAHVAATPTTAFLAAVGRWDEAEAVSDEAIGTYQVLVDESPDDDELGYRFAADSFEIAARLSGKPELLPRAAALASVTVAGLRPIAVRNPAYRPQLADWIMSPTVELAIGTGDRTAAIAQVREAIDLYVALNATDPTTYGPKLARARQRLAELEA
ncbi:tetratricopeptide repeat protein [Embleya sp. NPDC020630]|uniref:tetratricopeptide repeat protein n=1 Tax=Embleya sp. NPDC020630 TaxID=3363979 RepID=UPI003794CCCA